MIIYISHSSSFNFKDELYKPLKESGIDREFIFPHDKTSEQYPTKELLESKKCDLVIAEVSFPSTGQGIELGWANDNNISIICIYKKGSTYSKALNPVSKNFTEYTDSLDLIEKVRKAI
jgi:hypothetical protein